MEWIISLIFAVLPVLIHEGGHFLAALAFGKRLQFRFSWGRLGPVPVPRWIWQWPQVDRWKLRVICHAGFALEIALIPFLPWPYQFIAVVHYAAYPFYAGESSDFEGLRKEATS